MPDTRHHARVRLLSLLQSSGYRFVTPNTGTIRRMHRRGPPASPTLRDIFGWSLPFPEGALDPDFTESLEAADGLERTQAGLRSRLRCSSVGDLLFLHSAFPTDAADSVFLGPDSYRFANLIEATLMARTPEGPILDIGTGSGVGGLVAGARCPGSAVTLSDPNPAALALAAANAEHAGQTVQLCEARGYDAVCDGFGLILANPPFIAGGSGRVYRDGGDLHGARLSLDWAVEGMTRLRPGGRLLLYTGSPILTGGEDQLGRLLADAAREAGCSLTYQELDPDIFGGELGREAYQDVERIAAVGAVLTRPA
ncbi:methyltransferase [Caulobacter sp. SLTY]|uniref:methyltransferase n=1 Tax=Caulobacter sp. SLTY TaxID=2683262 RepID=UPI001411B50C|nr:methyltransferase [Caulobacter sp. SLTY]NBB15684.1 methyltransferase [Caulobacter sp. SLTY]